jgi:hypothetical protein
MTRFLLPLILLIASPAVAGTIKQQQGPATLELHFPGEVPRLGLADLLGVTLTIEGHESLRVRAPEQLPAGAPWLLVERSTPERQSIGTKRVRWQLRYRFAPREPGKKIPFQFPDVVVREKEDEDQQIQFKPIDWVVVTSIAAADSAELRGITGIEPVPEVKAAEIEWRWLALAVLGMGGILLLVLLRFLVKRRFGRSHAQIALYEWQRLVALNLPEQNRSERFITLLTLLVRRFLERQFNLPARRQTTPEFLRQIHQNPALSHDERQFLTAFLQSSEAVKFANQPMTLDECRHWAEAVKQFLQRRIGP